MEIASSIAVGEVESLWRYPVKSMRGEELQEAFLGFAGVFGDRLYAFHDSAARKGFPYLTAREQEEMLQYRPVYRCPEQMRKPENLANAEALGPGVTPVYPGDADRALDVETPAGTRLAIDDPTLLTMLSEGLRDGHRLTLRKSERAMTDCRPVSLFSIQTARRLSQEVGSDLDKRRFRANVYLDLQSAPGFSEDRLVGRTLRSAREQ
ncbi:MAG: MOSC N-terminal beta barrel domain-containing protein [Acidobacteriaceae bacterium]